ncbi:hypothetical protein HZA86_00320 [Candidatus Uhrbacteria bacterium]|nr:hypothetical protein [Candidatus Uhrbacteria bacterium]
MPYLTVMTSIGIASDGSKTIRTRDLRVHSGSKPLTLEASGSDPVVWGLLRAGVPGQYQTLAHIGAAAGITVPRVSIGLGNATLWQRLEQDFGPLGDELLILAVRTSSAPGTSGVADCHGGMFLTSDWSSEQYLKTAKLGVMHRVSTDTGLEDGWLRFVLPPEAEAVQAQLDDEQVRRWAALQPEKVQKYQASIEFADLGVDDWNSMPTTVVVGPIGYLQFVRRARLRLKGTGWRFKDLEWRPGFRNVKEPEWVPLQRQMVALVQRMSVSEPLMLELQHPWGGCDTVRLPRLSSRARMLPSTCRTTPSICCGRCSGSGDSLGQRGRCVSASRGGVRQ